MITLVPYHMELLVSVVLKKCLIIWVSLKHLTLAESPHSKKSEHSLLSFPTVFSNNRYVIDVLNMFHFFRYGKSLLGLSREESGVLGDGMPGAGNADENEEDNEGKHPSLSGYYLNQYFSNFLANMQSK